MTIPAIEELKTYHQWMPYGVDKAPINVRNGKHAKGDRLKLCVSYDEAKAYWLAHQDICKGIGFFLTEDDPFTVFDLDKCIHDGVLEDSAKDICRRLNSYTEYSPSGRGLHIWVKAKLDKAIKSNPLVDCVEAYSSKQFMSVTENVAEASLWT